MGCCETGYAHTYGIIVFVASLLTVVLGFVDLGVGAKLATRCTYADGVLSLLLSAYGVITSITGVLFMYVLGRNFEWLLYFSNIPWSTYNWTTWILTGFTYVIGLVLGSILVLVSGGASGTCDVKIYAGIRLFTTVALPLAPVAVVLFLLVLALVLFCLWCVLFIAGSTTVTRDP